MCSEVCELMARHWPEDLTDDEIALVLIALRMADKRLSEPPPTPVAHLELVRSSKRRRR
jgi:hypothetical protein